MAPANASAQVVAVPQTFYTAYPGPVVADALAVGAPKADFFSGGTVEVAAQAGGRASRRIRARQPVIHATAVAQGNGEIYVIPEPLPANAIATGIGSTYHLAYGRGAATAVAEAVPQKYAGMKGHATAIAGATADAWYTAGRRATAQGSATAIADAVVLRSGVLHLDGNGSAIAEATVPPAITVVFQPQSLVATSAAYATAVYQRGAKGHGTAVSLAAGDGLLSSTAATAGPGSARTTATGRCFYNAVAAGVGAALATASADAQVTQTRAEGQPANATAQAAGVAVYLAGAIGRGDCEAAASSPAAIRTRKAEGVGVAAATAVSGAAYFQVVPQPVQCSASAEATVQRTTLVYGEGTAVAMARGANQINDIQRAPAARTVAVSALVRVVTIAAQPRTIAA